MKKNIALLLSCIFLLTIPSCNTTNTQYIGIISAMDNEIALLLKETTIKEEKTVGGTTFHTGTLNGKPVVISRGDIGKINASSGITSMLNHYDISKVIFTGVAGGTRDEESVFDQVIATSLVEHDYGNETNDGFVWGGGDPGKEEEGVYYYPDEELTNLAYQSAVSLMGEEHVFKGLIATGDQFIASKNYVEWLVEKFDAYACEMEGAAIAKVCTTYKKPFAVLRTLSDKADGEAYESYNNFADVTAEQSNKIVLKMLESL